MSLKAYITLDRRIPQVKKEYTSCGEARPLTISCPFEYDARYFQSYAKRKAGINAIYTRFLRWGGALEGQGKTALDIGAAFGYAVELLEHHGYKALGVDASRYACSRSRYVICGDAEAPPFKDESFDLITCFETVEHLMYPEVAIARFHDLLKAHGTLLVTTPTPLGEKYRVSSHPSCPGNHVYLRVLRHSPDMPCPSCSR